MFRFGISLKFKHEHPNLHVIVHIVS